MEDAEAGIVAALPESDDPGGPRNDQKAEAFSFASVVLSTTRVLPVAGFGFLLRKTAVRSLRLLSLTPVLRSSSAASFLSFIEKSAILDSGSFLRRLNSGGG